MSSPTNEHPSAKSSADDGPDPASTELGTHHPTGRHWVPPGQRQLFGQAPSAGQDGARADPRHAADEDRQARADALRREALGLLRELVEEADQPPPPPAGGWKINR